MTSTELCGVESTRPALFPLLVCQWHRSFGGQLLCNYRLVYEQKVETCVLQVKHDLMYQVLHQSESRARMWNLNAPANDLDYLKTTERA